MKKALSVLVACFFASSLRLGAAVPAEFMQEIKIVHECIGFSAASARLENDADKLERYWSALKAIGKRIPSPVDQDSPESWSALDRRLLQMARDYASYPERVQAIEGWYGGFARDVPRELRDLEGKMSDQEWSRYQNPSTPRPQVPKVENLQDKHLAPEYCLAWEAWLLAPKATDRSRSLTGQCFKALAKCANDDSIVTIMEFSKNYTATFAVKPHESSDYFMTNGVAYGHLVTILLNINNQNSIDAAMDISAQASSAGVPVAGLEREDYDFAELTIQQWNKKIFTLMVSGYLEKPRKYSRLGISKLVNNLGRTRLPAIETLLKKEDLAPWKKELLNQTREAILKHAPALPK